MIELSTDERNALLECINTQIKASPNAIAAAETLLPIAAKLMAPFEPVQGQPRGVLDDSTAEEQ